jgi:hypothetical protein
MRVVAADFKARHEDAPLASSDFFALHANEFRKTFSRLLMLTRRFASAHGEIKKAGRQANRTH